MNPDRLAELAEMASDGPLPAAEDAELAAALAADPQLIDALAAIVYDHLSLRAALRPVPAIPPAITGRRAAHRRHRTHRARRRPALLLWGGLVAACLALTVWLSGHGAPSAEIEKAGGMRITASRGRVVILSHGRESEAAPGRDLEDGDELRCAAEATATVAYVGEDTRVDLEPGTACVLSQATGGKRLRLDRGVVVCVVAPQPSVRPFVLSTARATATVVGTRFRFGLGPAGTTLAVAEGSVRLRDTVTGVERLVTAGASTTIGDLVFDQDFVALHPGEHSTNRCESLEGFSVLAGQPYPEASKNATWRPDSSVLLETEDPERGEIYRVPLAQELRLRIHVERAGTIGVSLSPPARSFPNEHFYAGEFPVPAGWSELVLHSDDFTPYRRPDEGSTRDLVPGMGVADVGLFGFATGIIHLDRMTVIGSGRADPPQGTEF